MSESPITRDEVDSSRGPLLLEFGATWCPHCQAIRADLAAQLRNHPGVRHIAIEDGKGLPLGRSFRVKLWPTLVFLQDGRAVQQLVRPSAAEIAEGFAALASPPEAG
jgi:thioredoxin 1